MLNTVDTFTESVFLPWGRMFFLLVMWRIWDVIFRCSSNVEDDRQLIHANLSYGFAVSGYLINSAENLESSSFTTCTDLIWTFQKGGLPLMQIWKSSNKWLFLLLLIRKSLVTLALLCDMNAEWIYWRMTNDVVSPLSMDRLYEWMNISADWTDADGI